MWIMNIVWPVNGLFGTVLTLLLYYRFGRLAARDASELKKRSSVKKETPFSSWSPKAPCTVEPDAP